MNCCHPVGWAQVLTTHAWEASSEPRCRPNSGPHERSRDSSPKRTRRSNSTTHGRSIASTYCSPLSSGSSSQTCSPDSRTGRNVSRPTIPQGGEGCVEPSSRILGGAGQTGCALHAGGDLSSSRRRRSHGGKFSTIRESLVLRPLSGTGDPDGDVPDADVRDALERAANGEQEDLTKLLHDADDDRSYNVLTKIDSWYPEISMMPYHDEPMGPATPALLRASMELLSACPDDTNPLLNKRFIMLRRWAIKLLLLLADKESPDDLWPS